MIVVDLCFGYLPTVQKSVSVFPALFLPVAGCYDKNVMMSETKQQLQAAAPGIFQGTPVLFAYLYGSYAKAQSHPFSDLDIGIYVADMDIKTCLDLELSLALRFDETLRGAIQAEVRVLNQLPLSVKGRILGEAQLIYSRAEEKRVAFETQVRRAYFDFLPVIRQYRQTYMQRTLAD